LGKPLVTNICQEETSMNTDHSTQPPAGEQPQATLFDNEMQFDEDYNLEESMTEADLSALLGFEEPPLLLVDTDPEQAVARQKEMMDTVFGGIGEERKPEKRLGLAMQQADIEQRHALRLLLVYQDSAELVIHLRRCLEDPVYGYGERGDNGRTIAQAMAALAEGDDIANIAAWLQSHREFQQRVLSGQAFSFRSLFDFADLDSFLSVVQRVGDTSWQLGIPDDGKHQVFHGEIADVWPRLCDTYVAWCDKDNEAWLADLKRRAARLPDSILRTARAERLRKERYTVEVKDNQVTLQVERDKQGWPRSIILGDQIGLSRLSGHSFYELAWNAGLNVRRFEISGTTRNKVPVEHIEVALRLAEALAAEQDISPEPVTATEVEAAYLRRMKAKRAELGPPQLQQSPPAIQGTPVAEYRVNDIVVTLLYGGPDLAYIMPALPANKNGETRDEIAVVLQRDKQKGVILALPVVKGRPRRGNFLMTTPLAEVNLNNGEWLRAVASWGAWLVWVLN
jgi:hypothetical protein